MVIYATLINELEENVIYLLIKITPRVGNSKERRRQVRIFRTSKIVVYPSVPCPCILEDTSSTEHLTGESAECELPM